MGLAEAFIAIASKDHVSIEPAPRCEWLDGLWISHKDKRAIEEAGYAVEVIRSEDQYDGNLAKNAIPMPIPQGDGWREWPRKGRYLIAPVGSIDYDTERGAAWKIR